MQATSHTTIKDQADRILVVDDDPTIRLLVREALTPLGFEVAEAGDGMTALASVAESSPDLVLLDVRMPGADGYAVCEQVRGQATTRDVPVIMMTSLDDLESIQRAYDAGATDFIMKPLNWLILSQRVRHLLRGSENLRELQRSQEDLANAQRLARLGSWRIHLGSLEIHASDCYYDIYQLGAPDKPIPFVAWQERVHPDDAADVADAVRMCIEEGTPLTLDHRAVLPDGDERIVHVQARSVHDADGNPLWLEGTSQDVTERRRAEEQVRYLAYHDSLTGLGNRLFFKELLDVTVLQAARTERNLGVLFLDLDNFKRINDTFGHSVGDELLKAVAGRLISVVRESDAIARNELADAISRLGGDEFTVLLRNVTDVQSLAKVARRVTDELSRPFVLDGHEVVITASLGIAAWPIDGEDGEALLRNADAAMYHAKEMGRNNYQFYTESMNAVALEQLVMEGKIRRALEENEFELYYQPKIDLATGAIRGAEALIRWRNDELGLVMPERFIPIAEEAGIIVPMGTWVVETACAQISTWHRQGAEPVPVSVNLSSHQFRARNLVSTIASALETSEVDPGMLELEITESTLMSDEKNVVDDLIELRRRGLRISIDDFGTGYSSLSYLRKFPIDELKIDRSFVTEIATNSDDEAITTAIIAMGRALHMRVIAEGVETEEQRELLTGLGCDEMQGYLVSPAVRADEFSRRWLSRPRLKDPRR